MKTKHVILKHLIDSYNAKCEALETSINEITESRNSESKSSAGDKHETGRAMAEIELNNLKSRLNKANVDRQDLSKIIIDRKTDEIGFGNLVNTNHGNYFIAIGLGKITIKKKDYFVISSDSPIGKLLMGKKIGEVFNFRNNEFSINDIQ